MSLLAFIADAHLSDLSGTAQWACCSWAAALLCRKKPDAIIIAGDVTSCGQVRAARRFMRMVEGTGIPFIGIPGNADMRNRDNAAGIVRAISTARTLVLNDTLIVALDAPRGIACKRDLALCREALGARGRRPMVVVTHCPLDLRAAPPRVARMGALFLSAHCHRDAAARSGGNISFSVRGLDPDKAIGGPPCVAYFSFERGTWRRRDEHFSAGSPAAFSPEEKAEFTDMLGLCCLDKPLETLEFAASRKVPCVELRALESITAPGLSGAISAWRASGGKILSLHMPALSHAPGAPNAKEWQRQLLRGIRNGIDLVTIHPPGMPVRDMKPGSIVRRNIVRSYAESIAPALARGVRVGIENLHAREGERSEGRRAFGCLPLECLEFVRELKAACGSSKIGITLDIGHARNNNPYSQCISPGDWYALTGICAQSYHLHQVRRENGKMVNHRGFDSLYGPLVSLSGFFWSWKTGSLRHAPIFLEVRQMAARLETLKLLRRAMA
ncbi:MAG: metallophosphoesterase [Kiritimatiellia bacterium]